MNLKIAISYEKLERKRFNLKRTSLLFLDYHWEYDGRWLVCQWSLCIGELKSEALVLFYGIACITGCGEFLLVFYVVLMNSSLS